MNENQFFLSHLGFTFLWYHGGILKGGIFFCLGLWGCTLLLLEAVQIIPRSNLPDSLVLWHILCFRLVKIQALSRHQTQVKYSAKLWNKIWENIASLLLVSCSEKPHRLSWKFCSSVLSNFWGLSNPPQCCASLCSCLNTPRHHGTLCMKCYLIYFFPQNEYHFAFVWDNCIINLTTFSNLSFSLGTKPL